MSGPEKHNASCQPALADKPAPQDPVLRVLGLPQDEYATTPPRLQADAAAGLAHVDTAIPALTTAPVEPVWKTRPYVQRPFVKKEVPETASNPYEDGQGRLRYFRNPVKGIVDKDNLLGVKYLKTEKQREEYVVDKQTAELVDVVTQRGVHLVELSSMLHWKGELLDTAKVREKARKDNSEIDDGFAPRGDAYTSDVKLKNYWSVNSMIWVCAPDPLTGNARFYTAVCVVDQFHHTSFEQGKGIIGAGEWIVENGALRCFCGLSGHYRPPLDFLYRSALHLAPAFKGNNTTVLLFDKKEKKWVFYPILDFIASPSHGGEYAVSE